MECKICHNTLSESDVRCSYCGAKVVKSNYGNSSVSENNNGINVNQVINNTQNGSENNVLNQSSPIPVVNNNQGTNNANKIEPLQVVSNRVDLPTVSPNVTEVNNNNSQVNTSISNVPNNNQYINNTTVNSDIEEDLAEHYLGERYQIFKKKKFSFATFFLGGFYMCYRKQYINAVVLFAASYATSFIATLTGNLLVFLVLLVIYIFYSIRFPKMYLEVVNKKIKVDIEQFSGKNYEDLRKKLLRESSTSSGSVVIAFLIFIAVGIIISIGSFVKGIGSIFKDIEVNTTPTEDVVKDNNKNVVGNSMHGYLKVKNKWYKDNSSTRDKLIYTSGDGNTEIEFRISDSTDVEEVVESEQEVLGGRTISVLQKNGWLISNNNNNINKEILVGKMDDGKVHIITISNTSNRLSVFDILDTYYI